MPMFVVEKKMLVYCFRLVSVVQCVGPGYRLRKENTIRFGHNWGWYSMEDWARYSPLSHPLESERPREVHKQVVVVVRIKNRST